MHYPQVFRRCGGARKHPSALPRRGGVAPGPAGALLRSGALRGGGADGGLRACPPARERDCQRCSANRRRERHPARRFCRYRFRKLAGRDPPYHPGRPGRRPLRRAEICRDHALPRIAGTRATPCRTGRARGSFGGAPPCVAPTSPARHQRRPARLPRWNDPSPCRTCFCPAWLGRPAGGIKEYTF